MIYLILKFRNVRIYESKKEIHYKFALREILDREPVECR